MGDGIGRRRFLARLGPPTLRKTSGHQMLLDREGPKEPKGQQQEETMAEKAKQEEKELQEQKEQKK